MLRPGSDAGDGGALLGGIEAAVEAVEIDVGGQAVEPLGGPLDLGDAGQEGEQAAFALAERAPDGGGHLVLDPPLGGAAEILEGDREGAALAFDHRRAAQQGGEAGAVESRRHGDKAQILAQGGLGVARQGHGEIAVEAALVNLVEQQSRNARQLWIGLDALEENALGEDGDAGARRPLAVEAGGVADGAAHGLAGQVGHPLRRRPRRQPPRREQEDLARAPGLAKQGRGDRGGLAGAGRGDQHGVAPRPQRGEQIGQDVVDGKRGHDPCRSWLALWFQHPLHFPSPQRKLGSMRTPCDSPESHGCQRSLA